MREFEAPKALIIYGEGLELPLERYRELLTQLGERGIKATLAAEGSLDPDLYRSPGPYETQIFYDCLTLATGADISRYAVERAYHPNNFKWGWQAVQSHAVYFPQTAQAVNSSRENYYSSDPPNTTPKFYYASNLLTSSLVALGHGWGIDLERGVNISELYYAASDFDYRGGRLPLDVGFEDFYNRATTSARVDVASLKRYAGSDDFRDTANVGTKTIQLFQSYCTDTLPKQKNENSA